MKNLVFILGAGRSGTVFLSRVLAQDSRFNLGYEYRYIWNYKQRHLHHDLRPVSDATESVKNYITDFFQSKVGSHHQIIVDKTPGNSFKIGFIREIFPDCKIVHIIRDGRDNILSRMESWYGGAGTRSDNAGFSDTSLWASDRKKLLLRTGRRAYRLVKRGSLPWDRWPVFAADNILPVLSHLITRRPTRYGERIPGLSSQLKTYGLMITCGIQWRECVMQAVVIGRQLPRENYIEIRYEDLVTAPAIHWARLADFFSIAPEGSSLEFLMTSARTSSCGRWRRHLTREQLEELEPHIRPTLVFLGYDWE